MKFQMRADYHTHTRFSPDGHDSMVAMCYQAIENGLDTIAFTEHVEWQPDKNIIPPFSSYFDMINHCRDRFSKDGLVVLSGVELGNPHEHKEKVSDLLSWNQFDIIISSLHWLLGESIQMEACFRRRDPNDVYADYFTALGEMASEVNADIIAHFDRILWRGALLGNPLNPLRIESTIRDTLSTIAWQNIALELNTRYLRSVHNWHNELILMLRWYQEEGGSRVVVNSDAHGTWQLGLNYDIAMDILKKADLVPNANLVTLATNTL